MPLSVILLISLSGLLLLWFTKKQKTGKVVLTIGILLLAVLSYDPFADLLLEPLEKKYPPYEVADSAETPSIKQQPVIKYVVVLGGGHMTDPEVPATSRISASSLFRLTEGIRIYRKNPGSKLLLSGGGTFDPLPESLTAANVAASLGVPKNDIILESSSKDTKDQARLIKKTVLNHPFILVTSASHMPRAMALFNNLGMKPIPAPTQHLAIKKTGMQPGSFFPNSDALKKSERTIYEHLGILWAKIRNQT